MSKYLITGRQGSGKTTVIKQLQKLGYTAYNTDDLPNLTKLQDRETGETIEWPDGKVDWSRYAWNWQKPEIEKLLASDEIVFIGAVVSNQVDFYPMFDKVFVITVSVNTLKTRLENHEHSSHHLPGEIDRITNDHEKKQASLINEGAEPISGERPPEEIANNILNLVGL
jgi:broad-specificity NMP kinase